MQEPIYVYFAKCGDLVKIGATISPRRRRQQLYKRQPQFLFGFFVPDDGTNIGREVESAFHRHFKHKLVSGYEYFDLSDNDLEDAKRLPIVRCNRSATCLCHPRSYMDQWTDWREYPNPVIMGFIRPKTL